MASLVTAAVAALLIVLVTRSTSRSASSRPRASAADGPALSVARTKLGRIVVDGRGRTLYLFMADRHGRSTCYDACARVWPPAIVSGRPRVGPGLAVAKVSTTLRRDHRRQLVYNGHPLYAMDADRRPGDIKGQGFLGAWFAVSSAGRKVGQARATPSY